MEPFLSFKYALRFDKKSLLSKFRNVNNLTGWKFLLTNLCSKALLPVRLSPTTTTVHFVSLAILMFVMMFIYIKTKFWRTFITSQYEDVFHGKFWHVFGLTFNSRLKLARILSSNRAQKVALERARTSAAHLWSKQSKAVRAQRREAPSSTKRHCMLNTIRLGSYCFLM